MSFLRAGSVGDSERGINNDEDLLIEPDASELRTGRYFGSDVLLPIAILFLELKIFISCSVRI
jgi:hypothetical protein